MEPIPFKTFANDVYNMGQLYEQNRDRKTGKKGKPLLRIPPTKSLRKSQKNVQIEGNLKLSDLTPKKKFIWLNETKTSY